MSTAPKLRGPLRPFGLFGETQPVGQQGLLKMQNYAKSKVGGESATFVDANENNAKAFEIKGKVMSLHDHSDMYDASNEHVASLRRKFFTKKCKVFLYDRTGKVRVVVQRSLQVHGECIAVVFFVKNPAPQIEFDEMTQLPDLKIVGDIREKKYKIMDMNDTTHGLVDRENTDCVDVHVAPNVDKALVALVVFALDYIVDEPE